MSRIKLDRRPQRVDRLLGWLQAGDLEPATHQVGVSDHQTRAAATRSVKRPAEPLLALWRLAQPGHRPARLGHDVGERGVTNVELPQCRARPGPRRTVAVQRQPGDQLERLRAFERAGPPARVDDLDGPDQPDHAATTARPPLPL